MTPKGGMLFFGVFLAIGVIALVFGALIYVDAQSTQDWPSTVGTVSYINIRSEYHPAHRGNSEYYTYYPSIYYNYTVNGQNYKGNVISKGIQRGEGDSSRLSEFVNSHSIGTQVTVYYDSSNPGDAVLQKNSGTVNLIPMLIGAVFTTIGVVGVFYFYTRSKSD